MKRLIFTVFLFFLILQSALLFYYKFLTEREIKSLEHTFDLAGVQLHSSLEERVYALSSVSSFIESVGFDADAKEINKFLQLQYDRVDSLISIIIAPAGKVRYVQPMNGNESVLDMDYFTTPALADPAVIRKTLDSRMIYLEGPRELLQGGNALIARKAIYRNDDFLGIAAAAIRVKDILDRFAAEYPMISISQQDGTELINSNDLVGHSPIYTKEVSVFNQVWTLQGGLSLDSRALINRNIIVLECFAVLLTLIILCINGNQIRFNRRLAQVVNEKTFELRLSEQKFEQLAYSDSLTGISNRLHFTNELQKLIQSDDPPDSIAVLFMNLNLFSQINETMGLHYGDRILTELASRLRNSGLEYHQFARASGDHFYFLFLNRSKEELAAKARKILDEVSVPFQDNDVSIQTSASIGISIYPEHSESQDELLRYADMAMNYARQEKSGYCLFGHKLRKELEGYERLREEIKTAIKQKQFIIYYQPQVDNSTNEIIGLEALLRWNHPDRGLVGPTYFMAAAEEAGLMIELTDMLLDLVCRQIHQWKLQYSEVRRVSVNIPSSWFYKRGLMESYTRKLASYEIDPNEIELEITEGLILKQEYWKTIQLFRRKGVVISIDDFGTMYSSLNYLKQFPVDKLKIDKSFVQGIGKSVVDETIIKAIIYLANELNYIVVAEGVETEQQLAFLKKQTCRFIQGYYYYKPMPLEEVEALLGRAGKFKHHAEKKD